MKINRDSINAVVNNVVEKSNTDEQQNFIDAIQNDSNNLICLARAGTGKTSTIIQAVKPMSNYLFASFGKDAVGELITRGVNSKNARTLNSICFSVIKDNIRYVNVDTSRCYKIVKSLAQRRFGAYIAKIMEIVNFIRASGEYEINERNEFNFYNVALNYVIEEGYYDNTKYVSAEEVAEICNNALCILAESGKELDLSDQTWWPYLYRNQWKFNNLAETVIIDEFQDMSWCQLSTAMKIGTRLALIGDDRQAIYEWRGASSDNVNRCVKQLNAKIFKLTTSFRCAKKIIALAQKYVPDIKAFNNAPDGIIDSILAFETPKHVMPGDFIIVRNNVDGIAQYLHLINNNIACQVQGTGLTKQLKAIIKDFYDSNSSNFINWLNGWANEKTVIAENNGIFDSKFNDLANCLSILYEACNKDLNQVENKLDFMTSDTKAENIVTIGTAHRLKGREANRVFMHYNFTEADISEQNVKYVALTRAKKHLTMLIDG
ncbi:MAG: ATP-dependent helicase [Thioploca sp.]|nr:ATP-dependent helicase [Thioploca sp.]